VLLLLPSLSHSTRNGFSWIGSLFLLPSNAETALSVAWSLQHEIIFYILFGLCFFGLKNIRYIYLWFIPILVVVLFFEVPRWVSFLVGIRNIEFLFGVAAYQLFIAQRFFRYRFGLVALGVISVAIFFTLHLKQEISLLTYPLCGFGFACILLGLVYIERNIDFSQHRVFVFLGAASYSIYLIHGPTMSVLVRLFSFVSDWYLLYPLLVITSCFPAILYYYLIETPLMAWAKNKVR
jgi:peptidoglycan/LPS O-acetylase OafA/YrhL